MTTLGGTPWEVNRVAAAVAGVVQSDDRDASFSRQPPERPVDVTCLDRTPGPGCEDVARLLPLLPRCLSERGLAEPLPAQRDHADARQRHGAASASLRIVFVEVSSDTLDLSPHVDDPVVKVDVDPSGSVALSDRK
jgi:hypothetical protein